jgi:hypothetical protein
LCGPPVNIRSKTLTCSSIWIYEVNLQAALGPDGECAPRPDRV